MTKLDLEFVGLKNMEGCITVDGNFVKLKKNKAKEYTCSVETDKKQVDLIIYKSHNYYGKNWFWWNLLYFVISIFGLFDVRGDKKCIVIDGRFMISTEQDTKAIIRRQDFEDGGKVVEIETSSKVEEIKNIQFYDKEAKARQNKMKKFKIATTIISLALIITLIVLL